MLDGFLAPRYLAWLLEGFGVTLTLSALTSVVALGLGFILCMARLSPVRLVAAGAGLWLSVFRNTPLLVQLFFWYFGVSALLPENWTVWLNASHGDFAFGLGWPSFEFLAGFVGLTLYSAAFMAEEYRAGINGVPGGQILAGRALGLGSGVIWRRIILPQAARNALPPLAGQVMNVVKNSSLTMAIGLAELSYASRQVETETFRAFEAFGAATLLYILAVAGIEAASQVLIARDPLRRAARP
jgi:polar amino acid transport system permease protein